VKRTASSARRQFGLFQRQLDNLSLDIVADAVPDTAWPGRTVLQRLWPSFNVAVIPAIEGAAGYAELIQCLLRWQV
jgi:hypothetical protein